MSNGKAMIIYLIARLKKTFYKMSQYYPKQTNFKVDLSNYATKKDLKQDFICLI